MSDPWGAGPGRRAHGMEGHAYRGFGGPPGPGMRRFRRGGLVALLLLALIVAGLATLISALASGEAPPIGITITAALIVLVLVVLLVRWIWRSARSIGALMEASDQLATGDLTARVGPVPGHAYERLATSFDDMAHQLQTNESRRRELLADIAHELRTPLQAIRGTVDGMREGLYPADDVHLRSVIERTEVMARLLDDLRTLSMADAGVLTLHPESVDPRGVVTDAIAAARASADEASVRIDETVGAGVPATTEMDPVRITEVLTNLLQNAITHSPTGSVVKVSLEYVKEGVRFEVHDQGSGIPPNAVDHIFDRFVTSADRGGTGLGLAIAKRLVDAHGGSLVVAETSAAGTTMRFALPIDARREER